MSGAGLALWAAGPGDDGRPPAVYDAVYLVTLWPPGSSTHVNGDPRAPCCSYGLDLFLLSIDEGISGYRDDSLETVKRNEVGRAGGRVWRQGGAGGSLLAAGGRERAPRESASCLRALFPCASRHAPLPWLLPMQEQYGIPLHVFSYKDLYGGQGRARGCSIHWV